MQNHRNFNWMPREQNKAQNGSVVPFSFSIDEKLSIMEALDHIHVTRQYQEMGSCSVCKKISVKKCSGCGTFYCSSECQTFDWPRHRISCTKHLDNLSEHNSFASSRRMHCPSTVKNLNEETFMMTDRSSPFTALANQLKKKSGNVLNGHKNVGNFKIANKQYQNKEQQPKSSEVGCNGVKDHKKTNANDRKKNFSPKKNSNKKLSPERKKGTANGKNIAKNNLPDSNSKLLKAIENIPNTNTYNNMNNKSSSCNSNSSNSNNHNHVNNNTFIKRSRLNLSKIGKMEVIGTYRESPDRYWVMDVNNLETYEEIQVTLNKECTTYDSVQPKKGFVYGCIFADEWFRGKIVALIPEVIVHFIDYGNVSNYENKIFKKLPEKIDSVPSLAFLIEFEENTPNHYKVSDLDSVKLIIEETSKTSDGVPRVKVIDETFEAVEKSQSTLNIAPESKNVEKMSPAKQRSVMDTITANTYGMLFFIPGEGSVRFASIVPDNDKDATDCIEKVLNIDNRDSAPFEAKEGEYVLVVDNEGNDQRGKVLSKLESTYYVQLIDCGNVISTDNVYPLPDYLKGLVELGVKVTVQEIISQDQMKELETCFFTINGPAKADKWPCTLKGTKQQIIAKALLEKPVEVMEWQPEYVYFKSGSTVEISSISSPNSFYIRSVDAETEQKFLDMNMEMIQFAPNAKHFDIPPLAGELCCAKFEEDGCFYRAIVNSVERGKIMILFVDFGNEQETDLRDLKPLPKSLKSFPFFAVKVRLHNVSKKPWNNLIKEYIGKLISDNVELTLTYKDSINDGVTLREKVSGTVVNDFIEKAKDKSAVNSGDSDSLRPKASEIFLDDDMKYTTIPSGNVCVLAVLYVSEYEFETNHTFWATIADVENFTYVNGELSTLISEHCTAFPTPYKPSYRELCLAEYEDCWYRAICAGSEGDVFKVFFVDFGNLCELKPSSIRKMNKKFIKAPALAMNCGLHGHEKLKGNPGLTHKICGMLLERMNTLIKGVEVTKFEEDTFLLKIPEIDAILSS